MTCIYSPSVYVYFHNIYIRNISYKEPPMSFPTIPCTSHFKFQTFRILLAASLILLGLTGLNHSVGGLCRSIQIRSGWGNLTHSKRERVGYRLGSKSWTPPVDRPNPFSTPTMWGLSFSYSTLSYSELIRLLKTTQKFAFNKTFTWKCHFNQNTSSTHWHDPLGAYDSSHYANQLQV